MQGKLGAVPPGVSSKIFPKYWFLEQKTPTQTLHRITICCFHKHERRNTAAGVTSSCVVKEGGKRNEGGEECKNTINRGIKNKNY
jgi:hypothetical protein